MMLKKQNKQNTNIRLFIRARGTNKIFAMGLVFGALVGCKAGDLGTSLEPDGSKAIEAPELVRIPVGGDNEEMPDTEENQTPDCDHNNTCPRDTMSAISVFEDLDSWEFNFPEDLQNGDAWLNQALFSNHPQAGYDLSKITAIRVDFGNYILVKSQHGDRILSFSNHGPYWAGSNDFWSNDGQDNWLTLENARWTGTHTATLDLCVHREHYCRTISITLEE